MSVDLDGLDLARADPAGMLATVEASPRQWAEGLDLGLAAARPASPRAVVVAGMGGSGIVGDVVCAFADERSPVPVVAVKGYDLPAWVGPGTLVVLVSYSGGTAETLACLERATEVGAARLAVTSGGELAERAHSDGWPAVIVPGGRQPRASLAYLAAPVLVALDRAGVLPGVAGELAAVPDGLERCVEAWAAAVPRDANPVKGLAHELDGCVPVFYGARGWPAVAALRAKCQVNENAERPAFNNQLPERDHNEIVGWSGVLDTFAVVDLRDAGAEDERIAARHAAGRDLLRGRVAVHEIRVEGRNALERLASAVLHVDLLSVYLALLAGVDPTPVAPIDELKRRLVAG